MRHRTTNRLPLGFAVPLILALCGISNAQNQKSPSSESEKWNQPQAPFRIFGNTYYVGPHGLSSILITSPQGHILIDGALPESPPQIVANIKSLGFRIEDVKLIVNSHVHYDHAGGIAELQRLSGARVVASAWSAEVMTRSGVGRGDPQYGIIPKIVLLPHVDVLQDGQTFTVGPISITAHLTPGHTPGGTSWTWRSCQGDKCLNMVYADSLTPVSADRFKFTSSQEYPQALKDFEKSFAFFDVVPCDILMTTHPDVSDFWDRFAARERGVKPDPMTDPAACRKLADSARGRLRQRVAEETSKH